MRGLILEPQEPGEVHQFLGGRRLVPGGTGVHHAGLGRSSVKQVAHRHVRLHGQEDHVLSGLDGPGGRERRRQRDARRIHHDVHGELRDEFSYGRRDPPPPCQRTVRSRGRRSLRDLVLADAAVPERVQGPVQ
ncbi:MAG: hypothetical protein HYT85_19490 [candidate division NC10 bacterium]|nr:hypothetical protein [candidate division NC10 bacterium]